MKKILVPLDGSQTGEEALPWAKMVAEKQGLSIKLIRCFRPLATVYSYPDFATPPPVAYDLSGFIRVSEKYLRSCISDYGLPETTTIVVKEGEPAETILEHSKSEDIECIALSSHGRGGLGRWLLGSTTTKIVRASTKPVYILKANSFPSPPSLSKILVCLDGSRSAERALEVAARIAECHGSEITLFRAVDFFPYSAAAYQAFIESKKKDCLKYLVQVASRYPNLKMKRSMEVVSAVQGILENAPEFDLVVLASHGLSGLERWLLGSVTEKVMHKITKPLLVVRALSQSNENLAPS